MLSYQKLYHRLTNKVDIEAIRLEMVNYALENGICKSVKYYNVDRQSVNG